VCPPGHHRRGHRPYRRCLHLRHDGGRHLRHPRQGRGSSSPPPNKPRTPGARCVDRPLGRTYLSATPTTWSALLSSGWGGDSQLTARSGGEPLPEALAERLLQRCAGLWNSYGPTETTDVASCADIVAGDPITVGRPLPGTWVYVLDPQGRLLPPGVPGELVIGGAGVARGYLNRPVETAEFPRRPFPRARPRVLDRRPGTLARRRPDPTPRSLRRAAEDTRFPYRTS